jgi:hypothetical protein
VEYNVGMASDVMIHMPSFMMISSGVQTMLMFGISNLRAYGVGMTDGRYLRSTSLR